MGVTLDFGNRFDKTLLRRMPTVDIGSYFPLSRDESQTALLARALELEKYVVAAILLKSPTSRATDPSGEELTALFERAVREGQVGWLELLLSDGRDIDAVLGNGRTPLNVAVVQGQFPMVELLVRHHANINKPSNDNGLAVLQIAIQNGFTDITRLLLDNKVDLNTWVGSGTALLSAVDANNIEIVKLLLENDLNVNLAEYDPTGLQSSLQQWNGEMENSTWDGDADSSDFDDNVRDLTLETNGLTPLKIAAEQGYTNIVKLLLDYNAYVNSAATGTNGLTALQAAAGGGHTEIVNLLLAHNADVNAKSSINGWTALQGAVEYGNSDLVEILLNAGAHVNAPPLPANGNTPLQQAVLNRNPAIVYLLLDHGACVNAERYGADRRRALQIAVESGDTEIVQRLLNHGADFDPNSSWFGRGTILQRPIRGRDFSIDKVILNHRKMQYAKPMRRAWYLVDVILLLVLLAENTSAVDTGVSNVNVNVKSYHDVLWKVSVLFRVGDDLVNRYERRNWRATIRKTLIRTALTLILTKGVYVKGKPSNYQSSVVDYIEFLLVYLIKTNSRQKPTVGQISTGLVIRPILVLIVRLVLLTQKAPSFEERGWGAALAGPISEAVVSIFFPNQFNFGFQSSIREHAYEEIVHLGYSGLRVMAAGHTLRHGRH